MKCTIVGIAGGSGSGKTTLSQLLATLLAEQCATISSDDYYHDNGHLSPAKRAKLNFDHPDALDLALLSEHLNALRNSESVAIPKYCFETHTRLADSQLVVARRVVFVEGVLIFSDANLRAAMDIRIFVDADDDVRFERRLDRDTKQRNRSKECVTAQWKSTVAPMYEQFVKPTRRHAHLVINSNESNAAVIQVLASGLRHATHEAGPRENR